MITQKQLRHGNLNHLETVLFFLIYKKDKLTLRKSTHGSASVKRLAVCERAQARTEAAWVPKWMNDK